MSESKGQEKMFQPSASDDPQRLHYKQLITKNLREVDEAVTHVIAGRQPREYLDRILMRTYSQIYELRQIPEGEAVPNLAVEDLFIEDSPKPE